MKMEKDFQISHVWEEIRERRIIRNFKILIWNITDIKNKDFWRYVEKFDIVGLIETWVTEKKWLSLENNLPAN